MSTKVNSIDEVVTSEPVRLAASSQAARLSLVASAGVLVLLAALHVLSPELDPSWRMVSEYALGNYGWVLSLMFLAWAVSSWALAFAISSQVRTLAGKIGLIFLIVAGTGEAMAAAFDVNHPLHGLAGGIGIPSLPIAAMLISTSLARTPAWSSIRKTLLWSANLTWVSVLLMTATLILLMITYAQAGGEMTPHITELPSGVIAVVGWANRFLVVVYCVWAMVVARHALNVSPSHSA